LGSTLAFHDTDPDIVRDRRGAGEHEAGDDRHDGYECNRGDAGQKEIAKRRVCSAAAELRQQRSSHVLPPLSRPVTADAPTCTAAPLPMINVSR